MLLADLIVIFAFSILISKIYKSQEKRKNAIIFVSGIVLFLYAALRSEYVGIDTAGYIAKYNWYSQYSFEQIREAVNSGLKDPGYQMAAWMFSQFFPNPQWWLAFIAAVYTIPVMCFIKKYSQYPIISILLFIGLSYFSFSLTGLRQTMAMALTLCSIKFIEERKLLNFILFVLMACLFHTSAIVFLIVYPLANLRINYKHLIVFMVVGALFFGFQSQLRVFISLLFGENRLAGYADSTTSLTASGFIIQLCVFLFCAFYYLKSQKNNMSFNMLMNLSFIGLCFQMFASMIAEMFRVSMYFSIANIVLIPIALTQEKDVKIKYLEVYAIFCFLFFFIFRNGIPEYSFFWNQI